MKKLRLNMVSDNDMCKKIEYITLDSFINQTLKVVNQRNIIYNYNNTRVNTIREIKDLYT